MCFTCRTEKKTPFYVFFSRMCTPIYLNGPPATTQHCTRVVLDYRQCLRLCKCTLVYHYRFILLKTQSKWIFNLTTSTKMGGSLDHSHSCNLDHQSKLCEWKHLGGTAPLGLIFEDFFCIFLKIKQLWTKKPMDLVRNVPRNSKITVLL